MSSKDNIDNNCLHEINRKLDIVISFLSGVKGPAPALSGIKAPKFPLPPGINWSDIVIKLTATFALISIRNVMPPPATWDARWRAGKPRKVNFVELDCYDKLRKSRLNPDRHCMHECVLDGTIQAKKYGIKTLDIAKRLLDYGFHPPTIYFPLIVHEALMIEPTETESKETMDEFIAAMIAIAKESATTPEVVKNAPTITPVGRLDEVKAARELVVRYKKS